MLYCSFHEQIMNVCAIIDDIYFSYTFSLLRLLPLFPVVFDLLFRSVLLRFDIVFMNEKCEQKTQQIYANAKHRVLAGWLAGRTCAIHLNTHRELYLYYNEHENLK